MCYLSCWPQLSFYWCRLLSASAIQVQELEKEEGGGGGGGGGVHEEMGGDEGGVAVIIGSE